MITSSGPKCDVCGKYILPFGDEAVNYFSVSGIERLLHADNDCIEAVKAAGNDWFRLPPGPLRTAFEAASKRANHGTERSK